MHTYEQALATWNHAEQELARLTVEIEALQKAFTCLIKPLRTVRKDLLQEQAQNRLTKILVLLAYEHAHLLEDRAKAAQNVQNELAHLVDTWREDVGQDECIVAETTYDHVIMRWASSSLSLVQTERSIAEIQQAYTHLITESSETAEEEWEQEQERLTTTLERLHAECNGWRTQQTEAARAIECKLEQHVQQWRAAIAQQDRVLSHATTAEDRQAAINLRDQAQREFERYGRSLADFLAVWNAGATLHGDQSG